MRRDRGPGRRKPARGFTLFEMVVVICLIVILYMIAEQRLNELPAAAERASFYGVLAQVKAGINLEMLARLSAGDYGRVREMEGANPMRFLLEPPGNYRGEVDALDGSLLQRASWYFDRTRGELVYLVSEASVEDVAIDVAGTPLHAGLIRLKLGSVHGRPDGVAGGGNVSDASLGEEGSRDWQGLALTPVMPFEWGRRPEAPVDVSG